MNEIETIKEYSDRLLKFINQTRIIGEDFPDINVIQKVLKDFPDINMIQKVLVSILKRFEAKISSLEDSKDLNIITIVELIDALQAQEQRRLLRQEQSTEGTFQVKHK